MSLQPNSIFKIARTQAGWLRRTEEREAMGTMECMGFPENDTGANDIVFYVICHL